MKKNILITSLLLILCVTVTTGCGTEKQKTLNCTREGKLAVGTTFNYDYTVKYTGKYIDEINITEEITSDNKEYLETVKTSVENMYEPFKDIKYHSSDVSIKGNTLTSHRNIDYKHIDMDEMLEIDSAFASIIKDGKIALDDVKTVYSALGLTCK